jgi:hypothetical protein
MHITIHFLQIAASGWGVILRRNDMTNAAANAANFAPPAGEPSADMIGAPVVNDAHTQAMRATPIDSISPTDTQPRRRWGKKIVGVGVAAALVAGGVIGYNALSDDDGNGSDGTEQVAGGNNPFNPTAEELARFDCLDQDNEKYGLNIIEVNGAQTVEQVLPSSLPVEVAEHDAFHRETSDSLNSPFTVDLTKNNEVHAELAANLCRNPALLAGTIHTLANTPFNGDVAANSAEWMKGFAGKSADEISAMITNPHNQANFPEEKLEQYIAENLAATNARLEYAKYTVAVLGNLQKRGNMTGMSLTSDYALHPSSAFNIDNPARFTHAEYTGDAFVYSYTIKGEDCVLFSLGFNTGALGNDGDMRPVLVQEGDVCEDEPETPPTTPNISTPPTQTTVPDKQPRPPVGANTDPSAGGSEEEGNDPENDSNDNGYGPGDAQPTVPATEVTVEETAPETVPATTGTLAPGTSVVANGNNGTAPANTDPTQGGTEGDPGAPQD